MKIPLVFTPQWLIAFALAVTLVLVASGSQAERAFTDPSDAQAMTPADATELEALENRNANFEQSLETKLGSELDALGDDVSRANLGALAPVHDARLSDRVDARIEDARAESSSASMTVGETLAGDRSTEVVSPPVAHGAMPAAPSR